MLPILRIIPVGGAFVAVLILVLAMSPPREMRQGVAPEMELARGPLIDGRDHPEWPQFLLRAAFRRADAIVRLSDLPDTPMRIAPVALPPERPAIVAAPAPLRGEVAMKTDAPAADVPAKINDVIATATEPDAPLPTGATPPPDVDHAKASGAAAAVAPITPPSPSQVDSTKPAAPTAETAAAPDAIDTSPVPLPPGAPEPPTKVAGLPMISDPDVEEITGTVSTANDATIPVDIGETSSTELPIVLPRERPPVLRTIERGRSSLHRRERRAPRRAKATAKANAKPAAASSEQPASRTNLFETLFANADSKASPKPSKRGKAAPAGPGIPAYPPTVYYPITSP